MQTSIYVICMYICLFPGRHVYLCMQPDMHGYRHGYFHVNMYVCMYIFSACTPIYDSVHLYVTGMLEDFGGCIKIKIYPPKCNSSLNSSGLASPIPGLMNAGRWANQLPHKQLKDTNLWHPSEPWAHTYQIKKEETLPCIFNSPTLHRTLR